MATVLDSSSALHASESDLRWFSSGYFLVPAAAMLPLGLLGDRYSEAAGNRPTEDLRT